MLPLLTWITAASSCLAATPSVASSLRSEIALQDQTENRLVNRMVNLEPITSDNALVFKELRLRALQDVPTAFSSTYAKESELPDEEWLRRSVRWGSDGCIGYLAYEQGTPCGLVACYAEEHNVSRAHVISMWVDPAFRRVGVGNALIEALSAWARARRLKEMKLMVTSVNQNAIQFYERVGFRMSGITGPYPNDPAITEYEMLLPLQS